tara:strand:+ start:3086 stop:3973 length:888 start_codon:yes stop_codon:yes gene_type:complete
VIKESEKYSNYYYLNKVKDTIIDPLGRVLLNETQWIELNNNWKNAKFPVLISGSGDPILFLHGFDSSLLEFRRIYPYLKNNFQLIIPDLLGFGFSPRIFNNQYNPENIILNLIDLIKELNITKKIKIVGASMGGSAALQLSKEIANNIDKIILLSPAGLFEDSRSIPKPFNQIGAAFLGLPLVRRNLCRQAFAYPDKSVGIQEEQIASIHLGCDGWRNSLASFASSGGFGGSYKYLQNIPIKTVCGLNDRILGKNEINNLKKNKGLNFLGLENCGHLPHLDLPELTSKIIFDYFN